jgi:hypothetical protein
MSKKPNMLSKYITVPIILFELELTVLQVPPVPLPFFLFPVSLSASGPENEFRREPEADELPL